MSLLAETLLDRVAKIIPRYSMLSAGDRIGVAVSGGADSVVLLHLLDRLSGLLGIELVVLHVNHQLRGVESDADEAFVRELAASLQLALRAAAGPVSAGNLEQEARRIRREFFHASMAECGLRRVALGHTRSDQVETLLYRLLRGSGLAGLAGMRPVTDDGLIRPLLTISRAEVRDWAAAEDISWREDSSNADARFARNRLRNEAIPWLAREFNSNLEAVLAGTAELAQAEEDFWNQQIEPIYQEIAKRNRFGLILQMASFRMLHPAAQRRVLRRAVQEVRGDLRSINLEHIAAILRVCGSSHAHDRVIVPGLDALRSFDQLLLTRPGELHSADRHYEVRIETGRMYQLPFQAGDISLAWVSSEGENYVTVKKEQSISAELADLDADALRGEQGDLAVFVRNWEPGDRLWRAGHSGPEKIKALFQQEKVLLWERRHWPVAVSSGEIVWARQFGAAEKFAASVESRQVLRLTYSPGSRR
jgi:tRNA(Ile)-lysidine synthase